MKKKVLMVSPFVNLSVNTGNKIHQTNIVKHLSNNIHLKWIVQGDYDKKNVEVIPVERNEYGVLSGLSLLWDCFHKVNEHAEHCDVVHDRGDLFCIGTLSKLLGKHDKPVVMQVDGDWVEAFVKSRKTSLLIKPLMKAWVKKMFRTADVLCPVSKTLAKTIVEDYGISEDKVVVNQNGADVELFSKINPKEFDEENPRLVFLGALGAWYDVYTILESMKLLKDELDLKCTLVLSGLDYWPDLHEKLVKFIEENGLDVSIMREIPHEQVPTELNKGDILLAPYLEQAYGYSPLKIFEYMLVRKPIISNSLPEVEEILTHGENALLVPPEDAEAMSQAIRRIVKDKKLREMISKNAMRKAVREHSWERHAKDYEKIYKKL